MLYGVVVVGEVRESESVVRIHGIPLPKTLLTSDGMNEEVNHFLKIFFVDG